MKFVFPEGLYADVRIEHLFSTKIAYTFRELDECKEQQYSAAFIRMYDGGRWYYACTSDLGAIQSELDSLAKLASKNDKLYEMPVYKNFSSEKGGNMAFSGEEVSGVPLDDKVSLLQSIMPLIEHNDYIKLWRLTYLDEYKVKEFYNSKGAELKWDFQRAGFSVRFQMAEGDKRFSEAFPLGKTRFSELTGFKDDLIEMIDDTTVGVTLEQLFMEDSVWKFGAVRCILKKV
jgi:TldD protein